MTLRSLSGLNDGTKPPFDERGHNHGFGGVTQGKNNRAPDIAIAQKIGRDGRGHCADDDREPCARPKTDQHAGRNPRGRPENGNAIRLGQQEKTKARRQEIGDAERNGEACEINPWA